MNREDILNEAKKCVCGQREQDYGSPESNFELIADLWNAYLGLCENGDGVPIFSIKSITSTDVAMMMALLKIARIRNGGGTGDSFVDLAGYAACGGEICADKKNDIPIVAGGISCKNCKYRDSSFMPCNACEAGSEFEKREDKK